MEGAPLVTAIQAPRGQPTIPFIGVTEAFVLSCFRRQQGVSMQKVREGLSRIAADIGVEHALASSRLYSDGAQLLYDYAEEEDDEELAGLTELSRGQRVFPEPIRKFPIRIRHTDGWAERLVLPVTDRQIAEVDARRGFGQPMFVRGGVMNRIVQRSQKPGPYIYIVREDEVTKRHP